MHLWIAESFICIEDSCYSGVKLKPWPPRGSSLVLSHQIQPTIVGGYQAVPTMQLSLLPSRNFQSQAFSPMALQALPPYKEDPKLPHSRRT